jgi:hypothetical protein
MESIPLGHLWNICLYLLGWKAFVNRGFEQYYEESAIEGSGAELRVYNSGELLRTSVSA